MYARVEGQHVVTTIRTGHCSTVAEVGKHPQYLHSLFKGPSLTAGGRMEPLLALDFRKSEVVPDVTVVMSVYNAAPALRRSLPSLFETTAGSWELVIILDACYDSSYNTAVEIIRELFRRSSSERVRIVVQPTAVWEVSSDNIGMQISNPALAYVLFQADTIMVERGWNLRMLRRLSHDKKMFAISGRCGHSFDGTNLTGRCGADVHERLPETVDREVLHITETVNRGPLMLRAQYTQTLGFMDECQFLLEDDDHDLNRRARAKGYIVGYLPVDFYAPLNLSPRRNPEFRSHTPEYVLRMEQKYKEFRVARADRYASSDAC